MSRDMTNGKTYTVAELESKLANAVLVRESIPELIEALTAANQGRLNVDPQPGKGTKITQYGTILVD